MGRMPASSPSRRRSTSQPRNRSRSPKKSVSWREDDNTAKKIKFDCDGLPPAVLRVSVNMRYSRSQQPLLPLDVFVAAPAGAQLADVYARAAAREPDNAMNKYKLRRDKRVYVIREPHERNSHANVDDTAASIVDLNPLRLIFCVTDGPPPPPPPAGLILNARVFGSSADVLPEDVELANPTSTCTVADVWQRALRAEPKLARHNVRCLSAKRPADGVSLRIGLEERVADVATLGAQRYLFELESDGSTVVDVDENDIVDEHELDEEEDEDEDEDERHSDNEDQLMDIDDVSYDSFSDSYYDDEESGASVDNDSLTMFSYRNVKQPKSILRKSTSGRSVGRR